MKPNKMDALSFQVKVCVGGDWSYVPRGHAIVGMKGVFVRDLLLGVGTPLLVQISKARRAVTLRAVVDINCGDLGAAMRFERNADDVVERLTTLLAA